MIKKKEQKKYKVSFPHMGTVSLVWSIGLRRVGVEPYVPPYTSKETLSLGIKHSPEAICLPYKLILGNFIQALDGGADFVAMISAPGTCRLGEYSNGVEYALKELGYETKFVNLKLYNELNGMYDFLRRLTGKNDPITFAHAIYLVLHMVFSLDKLESIYSYYRAREAKFGNCEKIYKKTLKKLSEANTGKEIRQAINEAEEAFKKVELDETREILHVGITGEIYVVLDQFSNQDIEKELGKMGVEVHRCLNISSFIKDTTLLKHFFKGETHLSRAERLAKPYLSRDIGGDALESVSDIIYAKEQKRDGIIHLSPFTCMPEIMSQNIFPSMREDVDIPILSLILDEQTGKAGYLTRLEAFVDLMRRKKRRTELNKK